MPDGRDDSFSGCERRQVRGIEGEFGMVGGGWHGRCCVAGVGGPMPKLLHETLVMLFQKRPRLAPELIREALLR